MKSRSGFSLIEILVVVAVVLLLSVVALLSLTAMRDRLLLNDAENSLIFHLEESKARAVSGVAGVEHGIYFSTDGYTQFSGDVYDEEDGDNTMHLLDPRLTLSTDILEDDNVVVFSRITGDANQAVVVTITLQNDPDAERVILIGDGGDISSQN